MTDLINGLHKSKLELLNLPYDLIISTATVTCSLNVIFNVENIGLYFNDYDDIIIGKRYGNRVVNNLVNVKKALIYEALLDNNIYGCVFISNHCVPIKNFHYIRNLYLSQNNSILRFSNPNFTKAKKQALIPIGFDSGFTKQYLKFSKN